MSRIVLLGSTGFVGKHLCRELARRGHSLLVLARNPEKAPQGTEAVRADLLCADLARHFEGADAVINLVGVLHAPFDDLHVKLPERIAQACEQAQVPRLLHMSALGASAEGPSEYLKSKFSGEQAIRAFSGCHTIFRPSIILGEGDHFVPLFAGLMKLTPILPVACPDSKLQPVQVSDVARAFADSLEMQSACARTFCLCGPEIHSLIGLVRKIADSKGMRRMLLPLPDAVSRIQARLLEFTPGPLMTFDNYLSLQKDNVCEEPFPEEFGWKPAAITLPS